ncbi:YHS domain-containing (seleno)protein [uncultured Polaribacter sp.]|uniref:YHS domain-containing (seleno)protein n=1 Tax=uncultured Polaribacter sp. TaxID=174711 RepID=UPI002629AB57|nr:YHS domain-containing (seleno)protein [uncultured Polaribacter sp.]
MKNYFTAILFFFSISFFAQDYNLKGGYVAEGYDVVAYFNNIAAKGNKKFSTTYDGVQFKFVSKENLKTFVKSPKKYIPAYGGYCAYAIGVKGEKVSINPKTFEIRDGKLYLFYNAWGTNTLELWQKEGAEDLKQKADKNWKKIIGINK